MRTATAPINHLADTAHAIGTGLRSALRHMQTARMRSVLHAMTDADLARIGTSRGEIDAYARRLIAAEG